MDKNAKKQQQRQQQQQIRNFWLLHMYFTRLKQVKANAGVFEKEKFLYFLGWSETQIVF